MRARAVVAAVLAAVLAAGAAAGEEVREESPFMVGDRTYASYFHEPQDTPAERAVVGRYGTIPFDYPDAASCLEDGSAWPDVRSVPTLDWGALDDRMEVEVCLYRVLRHFR